MEVIKQKCIPAIRDIGLKGRTEGREDGEVGRDTQLDGDGREREVREGIAAEGVTLGPGLGPCISEAVRCHTYSFSYPVARRQHQERIQRLAVLALFSPSH